MDLNLPSDVTETFFDMDTLITPEKMGSVKLQLMSRIPASLISAVSWIDQNLNTASDAKKESLIEALINNDILTYFCEDIAWSYGHLYTSMLEIVRKLISNKNFYKKNLARLAVQSIIRTAFIMAKKMEHHEETLISVAVTLYQLLDGASKFQVSLDDVYYPDQMVAFLERLDPKCAETWDLRSNAAKILCIIMSDLKLPIRKEIQSSLFKTFENSLISLGNIVLTSNDASTNGIIQTCVEMLCSICTIGTRFCKKSEGNDFAMEITVIMIDVVIPHFKKIKFEPEVYQKSLQNLINCLDEIFKLENNDKELANVIASHGYLKYFLEISVPNSRKSVSSLLSRITAKLSEDDFAQSGSPEGLAEFQNNINKEILALPSDVDISTILKVRAAVPNALLILLYYHSHKTHEYDLMPPSIMILKLLSMVKITAEDESDLVLKAVWFLFMVSSQKRSLEHYSDMYPAAVTNLANLLQCHELRKCYTHNRVLLDCSLNCENFPINLRYEIVRLWLDFDDDIECLVESPKIELIDDCLVNTIETSSGNLVNQALKVLTKLKSDKQRWARICQRVWEKLPRVLTACNADTAVNVKELLKIAQETKPGIMSLKIYKKSGANLAKVLTSEMLNDHLKFLLLEYVNTLLKVALERNSPTVVKSCVKHAELFTILRDKGLARENFVLSGCCMDLMVNILESQVKFKIQSSESDVVKIEPLKILVLLARSDYKLSLAAVRLLIVLLNHEEKCIMSVALADFKNDEAADEAISAWYKMVHLLLPKKQMEDWHLIYSCLISVLNFGDKINLHKTLQCLGDYSITYDLVRRTIDHEYTNPIFFSFVDKWHHYASKYGSANVISALNTPAVENLRIELTEFEEIMEMIDTYQDKVEKSRNNV